MTTDLVGTLSRVALANLPTPLHPAPRLSAALGVEVWLKRDDLTGLGLGGNKVRILEFLLGDALDRGRDVIVTGAGPQSNWALLAALAARRSGLECRLCFYGDPPASVDGNLWLQRLAGAHVAWTGDPERASVDRTLQETAARLQEEGRRPVVLPRGGATGRGSVGYALAAAEIGQQAAEQGLGPSTVWLATGSCGTQAGLVAGMDSPRLARVVGVTVSRPVEECRSRVHALSGETANLLRLPLPRREDVDVRAGWVGEGYGIPSPAGRAAQDLVARTEGVLLDPVFGAKAMAALVAEAESGGVTGPVVFLVTGGAPTLFVQSQKAGGL